VAEHRGEKGGDSLANTIGSKEDLPLYAAAEQVVPRQSQVAPWLTLALAYLSLTKPRVVGLVLFTAVASAFAAAEGVPPWPSLTLLLVTGFLVSGGAATLNHYFDRDIDGAMRRTRRRPLVTGQIRRPALVLVIGSGMMAVGLLLAAAFSLMLAVSLLAGAFTYVGIYTLWLKRRTRLNIVLGGASGSFAVIGGWALIDPRLGLAPLMLALVVFLWTPAHFWSLAMARSADYSQTKIPMLPAVVGSKTAANWVVIHVACTVALSLWLQPVAAFGVVYSTVAVASGLVFVWMGVQLLRQPGPAQAWALFKYSGVYLGLLFLSVLVDSVL
jgi:protoheme IX farnesyltransferase